MISLNKHKKEKEKGSQSCDRTLFCGIHVKANKPKELNTEIYLHY
jgi:hypothetical protein